MQKIDKIKIGLDILCVITQVTAAIVNFVAGSVLAGGLWSVCAILWTINTIIDIKKG